MKIEINKNVGDCHKNSKLVYDALKKLGYDVKLRKGKYINLPKAINHSWLEYKDFILETDCRQLRESEFDIMHNEQCAVLPKEKFDHRYKVKK